MLERLEDGEERARATIVAELGQHLALMRRAFDLVAEVLRERPEPFVLSQAFKVCAALLSKLSTDLRGTTLLAERGYPTQAVGVAASLYETAFAIAYIASDERIAQEWIERAWADPTRPFRKPWDLTVGGLQKLRVPDPDKATEAHYRTYTQLCMAKHAHPGFLLHHAFHRVGEELFIVNGPNTSDAALRAATFALEQAAGLAYIALASFIDNHAPENERASLHAKVNEMGRVRAELRASSILRWPGGDPFPGQWRRVKGKNPRK